MYTIRYDVCLCFYNKNPQSTTHDTTMTSKHNTQFKKHNKKNMMKKIDEQNRVKSLNDLKHLTNFIINAAVHTFKKSFIVIFL